MRGPVPQLAGNRVLGVTLRDNILHLIFFLPSNKIKSLLLWYLWYKDYIFKKRYLNKPCFRPISVKGLTGFSYGQDDPLHGGAQHHLPQEGTKHREKRERKKVQEKTEWKKGRQAAEGKSGCEPRTSTCCQPRLTHLCPYTPTAPSLCTTARPCPGRAIPTNANVSR